MSVPRECPIMETIITGFLLGLGLIGALFFVANIGWVLIAVACLGAIGAVRLFPGFFACIAILIIGGMFAPVVIEPLKKSELPKTAAPSCSATSSRANRRPFDGSDRLRRQGRT